MTPERIARADDERLYNPRIHSRWIRGLHVISEATGEAMTILVDRAIREYVERYNTTASPSSEANELQVHPNA